MISATIRSMLRWWTSIHPNARPEPKACDLLAREIPAYREAAAIEAKARRRRYMVAVHRARKAKSAAIEASLRAYVEGR